MDELRIVTKKKLDKGLDSNYQRRIADQNNEKSLIIKDNNNISINNINNYSPKSFNLFNYKTIQAHDSDVLSMITYNNYLVTGSSDKSIKIWDIDSGELIMTLLAHTSGIYTLAIWNDKLISGSSDKTIRIWDIQSGKLLTSILAHQNQIYSLFCIEDQNVLISSSIDKTIKVWDLSSKKILGQLNLEYSAWNINYYDKKIYAGLSDGSLRVFDIENLNLVMSCKEHEQSITALKIDKVNDVLFTASKDKSIKIWDLETVSLIKSLENVSSGIWTICRDSNYMFIGGDDKNLKVLDLTTQKLHQNLVSHKDWISQVISYKQRVISVSGDGILKLWAKTPLYNCENIDLNLESLDKSPFETDDEYNHRRLEVYTALAKRIINYDYISIGSVKLLVDEYDFETNILPIALNITCEKIIKLSKFEKQSLSSINIDKKSAEQLHKATLHNLYIKYYLENNSLGYELSLIHLDKKYTISSALKKFESQAVKKNEIKKDRLDININKPESFYDNSLFVPKHDCNSISLSDTFRKPFEDFSSFEKRVKEKLIAYTYINCGKVNLIADRYSLADQSFPMKISFTCEKLLNIININVDNTQKSSAISSSKQLALVNKYEFFGHVYVDRTIAKQLFENSISHNLYIDFIEKADKLVYELFIIFDQKRYFIM